MTVQEIKEYIKERHITYDDLSILSNVPIGTLKSIFSGRTPNPRIDTMQAIERALGLSAEFEEMPSEIAKIITYVSQLTDEECEEVSRYIDFVISKRKK